ncbi:MAG: LAGLIDADG family homing endonuclease [Pyrinomonadaceae bacterium]
MDNQQETALELGWIAGLIDGEGTIGISIRSRRTENTGWTTKPHVQLSNTDMEIVDRYTGWLSKNGVPFHISSYPAKGRRQAHKTVVTAGLKRVARLLPLVLPYLTGNKKRAGVLVNEFVTSRLSDWHAAPFTERQLGIVKELQSLHAKGRAQILRDYTRSSRSSKYPSYRDEDIVQAA